MKRFGLPFFVASPSGGAVQPPSGGWGTFVMLPSGGWGVCFLPFVASLSASWGACGNRLKAVELRRLKATLHFVCFFAAVWLAGCKTDRQVLESTLEFVPPTALSVAAVDAKRLMQKIDFEAVGKLEMFRNMGDSTFKKKDGDAWSSLKTLFTSGIDLEQKLLVVQELPGDTSQKFNGYVLVALKNAGNFEKLVRKNEEAIITKQEEGIRLATIGGALRFGWNEAVVVIPISSGSPAEKITKILQRQFPEKTVVTPEMVAAIESPHDVTGWFSTHSLAQHPVFGTPLLMMDVPPEVLKGNFLFTQIDFENGKVSGQTDFQVRQEFGEEFVGRFFKAKIATDFSSVVLKDSLDYFSVMSFDPEGIVTFLANRPQAKGYVEFALEERNTSPTQISKALEGDIFLAGVSEKAFLACRIKSLEEVEAWLQTAQKAKILRQIEPGIFEIKGGDKRRFCAIVNGFLCLSEDEKLAKSIRKFSSGTTASFAQQFENQCVGVCVLSQGMGAVNRHFLEKIEFKANADGADFSVEMKDKSRNSINVLMELLNEHLKAK